MEEIYSFDCRVAARWPNQIHVVPDDPQAFLAYHRRANLNCDPYWHGDEIWVSIGNRTLIARSGDADQVRYSVQAKATRRGRLMYGVGLDALAATTE